jgi:hypothetical protein
MHESVQILGQEWATPSIFYTNPDSQGRNVPYKHHIAIESSGGWLILCWKEKFVSYDENGEYCDGGIRLNPVKIEDVQEVELTT